MATLETPIPVVDLARVEANLRRMQDYCDAHGLKLRPHIKTHKIVELARRQMALGAVGLTCQKLTEAEVMLERGCDDILISYPMIGAEKARRLAALAPRARITVAADSPLAVETAAAAAREAGTAIGVLVEFDSGMGRTGVTTPEAAAALARQVADTEGLRLAGVMTYPTTEATVTFVAALRPLLEADGLDIPTVSGGGTPGAFRSHELGVADELRVGTYIYNDRNTVISGACTLDDCALHVLATVISTPQPGHFILDCGSKTLTSDLSGEGHPGYGLLIDYPDAVIEKLTEEHGIVRTDPAGPAPMLGEKVWILPNHVCPVSNLHDRVVVRHSDGRTEDWEVSARGCTR
ncbi:alanine racemase [Psychromarinibacter sp. C21-152]|uniref:Alanine racemase n=1 Tax=Psychromarinibacter sediminicola TaxID=3033385 RepID=A0AAE3NW04_9RHOB|nr:alanine racemase [Psychromarinibacter sediminicola]MDF0601667.1 alanine racemase [Psychromarinibacter sediminicola]